MFVSLALGSFLMANTSCQKKVEGNENQVASGSGNSVTGTQTTSETPALTADAEAILRALFENFQKDVAQRFENVWKEIGALTERMSVLRKDVDTLAKDFSDLKSKVATLETALSNLRTDFEDLKSKTATLPERVSKLEADVTQVQICQNADRVIITTALNAYADTLNKTLADAQADIRAMPSDEAIVRRLSADGFLESAAIEIAAYQKALDDANKANCAGAKEFGAAVEKLNVALKNFSELSLRMTKALNGLLYVAFMRGNGGLEGQLKLAEKRIADNEIALKDLKAMFESDMAIVKNQINELANKLEKDMAEKFQTVMTQLQELRVKQDGLIASVADLVKAITPLLSDNDVLNLSQIPGYQNRLDRLFQSYRELALRSDEMMYRFVQAADPTSDLMQVIENSFGVTTLVPASGTTPASTKFESYTGLCKGVSKQSGARFENVLLADYFMVLARGYAKLILTQDRQSVTGDINQVLFTNDAARGTSNRGSNSRLFNAITPIGRSNARNKLLFRYANRHGVSDTAAPHFKWTACEQSCRGYLFQQFPIQ